MARVTEKILKSVDKELEQCGYNVPLAAQYKDEIAGCLDNGITDPADISNRLQDYFEHN